MPEQTTPTTPPGELPVVVKRTEEFASLYANNILLESSAWDLKLLFGELDQSAEAGKQVVELHTAVTIPWVQVKLLIFYLQGHLFAHELENGKVQVPARVSPREPHPIPKELEDNPMAKRLLDDYRKKRDEFIAANK